MAGTARGHERKDVVASAAGEQRYGKNIGEEIGPARDGAAAQAQADPRAQELYSGVMSRLGEGDANAWVDSLDDNQLQALTRIVHSFRSTDPSVVRARMLVNTAMAKRGFDVQKFGAQGGGNHAGRGPDGAAPNTGRGKGRKKKKPVDPNAVAGETPQQTRARRQRAGDDNGDGRIDEDESGWDPATMGNRRGHKSMALGVGLLDDDAWDEGTTLGLLGVEVKADKPLPGPSQPSKNPGATKLREYWVHGEGAAKIRWGEPHDFYRCVDHMRKFVGARAEGLCNIYHRSALGVAPGKESGSHGKKSLDVPGNDAPMEHKVLFVERKSGDREMRAVLMTDPGLARTIEWVADEYDMADDALDEVKALDSSQWRALTASVVLADDDRDELAAALASRESKGAVYNPGDWTPGDPGRAPWQAYTASTGDSYVGGMMLGLAGLRSDSPVVTEAKGAGVPVVDIVTVLTVESETKDVATASGGTFTQPAFGRTGTESGDDEIAARNASASARAQGPKRLRHHYTRDPKGLQEWRPSAPGRFRRLTKALRKHVGAGAEGLAAVYYRQVMGHWPGTNGGRSGALGVKSLAHWDQGWRDDLVEFEMKGLPPSLPAKAPGKAKRKVPGAGPGRIGKGPKRPGGAVPPNHSDADPDSERMPGDDGDQLTPEEVAAAGMGPDDPEQGADADADVDAEAGQGAGTDDDGNPVDDDGNPVNEDGAAVDPETGEPVDGGGAGDPDADPDEREAVEPDDGAPRGIGDEGDPQTDPDTDPRAAAAVDPETGEPVDDQGMPLDGADPNADPNADPDAQPGMDAQVAGQDGSISPALAALFPELDPNDGGDPEGDFEDALLDDPDYQVNPDGTLQMIDDEGNPVDDEQAEDIMGRPDVDGRGVGTAAGAPGEDVAEDMHALIEDLGLEFDEDGTPFDGEGNQLDQDEDGNVLHPETGQAVADAEGNPLEPDSGADPTGAETDDPDTADQDIEQYGDEDPDGTSAGDDENDVETEGEDSAPEPTDRTPTPPRRARGGAPGSPATTPPGDPTGGSGPDGKPPRRTPGQGPSATPGGAPAGGPRAPKPGARGAAPGGPKGRGPAAANPAAPNPPEPPANGSKPGPVDRPGKGTKPGAAVNRPPFGEGEPPKRRKNPGPSRATKAILS